MLDLTPEQQVLREQFCSLRKEFTELFARKNEMQTYEESSLTSLYLSTVGEKQHEVFCLRTKIAAIKLRIELIQAYINRNEIPELKTVDEEIHIRFADHKKKIEEIRDRGVLMQLNTISLSGYYGKDVMENAQWMVENRLIDLIGSDCHGQRHIDALKNTLRNPYLKKLIDSGDLKNNTL